MYCHVTCALFGFQAEVAKKEKEAQKRELRSRRKALRALCKVGGAHGALCKVGGTHWGHSARWVGPMGALCKVGGAHGGTLHGGWGPWGHSARWVGPMGWGWGAGHRYAVPPALFLAQERGYFCGPDSDMAQHLQDLELLCEVLDAQQ